MDFCWFFDFRWLSLIFVGFFTIFYDFRWFFRDLFWFSVIVVDFRWFFMIFVDFCLIFIDFHRFSAMFVDLNCFSLIFIDFHWYLQTKRGAIGYRMSVSTPSEMLCGSSYGRFCILLQNLVESYADAFKRSAAQFAIEWASRHLLRRRVARATLGFVFYCRIS